MEAKKKFTREWEQLFPDSSPPDLSCVFTSKTEYDEELSRSEKKKLELKYELKKEEFIYEFLSMLKNDFNFLKSIENNLEKSLPLLSASEQLPIINRFEILELSSESSPVTFSSFQVPKTDLTTHLRQKCIGEEDLNKISNNQIDLLQPTDELNTNIYKDITDNQNNEKEPKLIFPKEEILNNSESSDDEHVYTNLDTFLNKSSESVNETPSQSLNDNQGPYENEQFQPLIDNNKHFEDEEFQPLIDHKKLYENIKLEHVVTFSENEETADINEKRQCLKKRHGSEDRKAFLFSDQLDIKDESSENTNNDDHMLFTPMQNNAFIMPSPAPSVIVNSFEKDQEYTEIEDDPVYININHIKSALSDDSGSENDSNLNNLNSIPSTLYREMTSDEYASLQTWVESDEECHSFDEEDSDDLPKKPFERKKNKVGIKLSKSEDNLNRKTSVQKRKDSIGFSKSDARLSEDDIQLIKASKTRKMLVMDLFDNERRYCDCLDMLMKFMKPLRLSIQSSQPILTAADFKSIFGQTEELYKMHKKFLNDLEPRIENWNDNLLIGDLFFIIMEGFKLYALYVGNYSHAMETLNKCRSANQQFKAILEKNIKIPALKDPLTLESLLYKPVDRITQYSLILNDLLKYTSPDHPDHPLIVEVSGSLFELLEKVNVETSKKKKSQRHLLKEAFVVEIDEGRRCARSLILFNDVIISAKQKAYRDTYVCKWYAGLSDVSLKPYENSEVTTPIPISSKAECDKLRASIANLRAEIRKDFMPLQSIVPFDNPINFAKRRNISNSSSSRSSSRGIEKLKKKITEEERLLQLIAPNIPLNLYHKSGKVYTFLFHVDSECQAWTEALRPRIKRMQVQSNESIHMSSLELQQALETVLKVQRLGIVPSTSSPFIGSANIRPLSVDFSTFDDKNSLTGYLYVNISNGKGFNRNSDTYVVLEMDSYGHYFKKAKTKTARGSDPHWDEEFDMEIEACTCLRLTCFNKLRLMGDDICGKCSINLIRENLMDFKTHYLVLSLDRGQCSMNVSLSFATSMGGIKKTKSFCETGVFGVPISAVCSREKTVIPIIVISCIKEIEKRGMDEVGIYRLSGIASEIQNIKKLFNDHTQSAVLLLGETDIHAVAGILKLYFRELPQSLFTGSLYPKFVEGLSIKDANEKEQFMLDTLHELPRVNMLTALYLFEHLRRVSLQENINKMGVNNLATVFGPTVLRTPSSCSVKENESSSCNVDTFDIGALDVMSQVGVFRYFLALKNNPRACLPEDDLELWKRLDVEKANKLQGHLLQSAEEFLI